MLDNYCDSNCDEYSMSNIFCCEDDNYLEKIPNPFEVCPVLSGLHQTFYEKEFQNNNVEENELNESNNLSILNGHQQSEEDFNLKPLNPLNKVEINNINDNLLNAPEKEEKKINEKQKENNLQNFNLKKTYFTSKKSEQLNPVIVKVGSKKISRRIDYGKKYFKTRFSAFLKNHANRLIQMSCLPKNLKQNISSPNSLSFTSNVKDSDNLAFLSFTVQEIFFYSKEGNKCKNSLQIKNQKKIENIMNFIENCENDEKFEKIYTFFKMRLEDAYELFYESEEFRKYAGNSKVIEQDKEYKAQNRISLLEKNGFIKMIKMCK